VSNLPDGSVEVVADGAAPSLADLQRALTRGPTAARVSGVENTDIPHDAIIPNFFQIK
jgi:acylphosphatase